MLRAVAMGAAVATLGAGTLGSPPMHPAAGEPVGGVPVLVIEGRGFGHGVGLSQEGAWTMAVGGASTAQILGQFYPGTAIARRAGFVRVPVLQAGAAGVVVSFPAGGVVREAGDAPASDGFPVAVPPGGRVRLVHRDGAYHVTPASSEPAGTAPGTETTTTTAPAPTTTTTPPSLGGLLPGGSTTTTSTTTTTTTPVPLTTGGASAASGAAAPAAPAGTPRTSSRPLLAVPHDGGTIGVDARGRRYRGVVEASGAGGGFRLVNQLDVEQYLRGMGEVRDPGWPAAALEAQAIVARTYALRAMATSGEVCETQRCQVYLGQQAEYEAMDRAVARTQGQVVVHGSRLAATVYSANGGGHSADTEEGFGQPAGVYPYLRAAPYPSRDPLPWTVRVALRDVAARLGYVGALRSATVGRTGPSGRALEVVLDGDAGRRTVRGIAVDAALGLRSTLFTTRIEVAATAPPPPAEGEGLQVLPDEIAAAPPAPVEGEPPAVGGTRTSPGRTSSVAIATDGDRRSTMAAIAIALLLAAAGSLVTNHRRTGP